MKDTSKPTINNHQQHKTTRQQPYTPTHKQRKTRNKNKKGTHNKTNQHNSMMASKTKTTKQNVFKIKRIKQHTQRQSDKMGIIRTIKEE